MAVALTCNVLSIVEIGNVTCCLHWQDVNIDNTIIANIDCPIYYKVIY